MLRKIRLIRHARRSPAISGVGADYPEQHSASCCSGLQSPKSSQTSARLFLTARMMSSTVTRQSQLASPDRQPSPP